jgi:hypothetical protein
MSPSKGVSVLASLTSEVMETKKAAARRLTPVEGERTVPSGMIQPIAPTFPSDLPGAFMSKEGMRDAAKDLRRHAGTMIEIADALDNLSGQSTEKGLADLKAIVADGIKAKEREADERAAEPDFNATFKAQQIKAQAAAFAAETAAAAAAAPAPVLSPPSPSPDWVCPTHKKPGIPKVSPSSGRSFIGCPECHAFAR